MLSQSSYRPLCIHSSINWHAYYIFIDCFCFCDSSSIFLLTPPSHPFHRFILPNSDWKRFWFLAPSNHFMQRKQRKSQQIRISNLGSFSWSYQLNSNTHLIQKRRTKWFDWKSSAIKAQSYVFIIYCCRSFLLLLLLLGKSFFDVAS